MSAICNEHRVGRQPGMEEDHERSTKSWLLARSAHLRWCFSGPERGSGSCSETAPQQQEEFRVTQVRRSHEVACFAFAFVLCPSQFAEIRLELSQAQCSAYAIASQQRIATRDPIRSPKAKHGAIAQCALAILPWESSSDAEI